MGYLPNITAAEMAESRSGRHYHTLIALSASARERGDHTAAQQYATAAHKWAMEEHVRLQQLVQAEDSYALATRLLNAAWDKDRTCETLDELREQHPESKRLIVAWERARDVLRELSESQTAEVAQ